MVVGIKHSLNLAKASYVKLKNHKNPGHVEGNAHRKFFLRDEAVIFSHHTGTVLSPRV